jgi:hypothetical protein
MAPLYVPEREPIDNQGGQINRPWLMLLVGLVNGLSGAQVDIAALQAAVTALQVTVAALVVSVDDILGDWTQIPFAAGDFTTSNGTAWTVIGANVFQARYKASGKTVTLALIVIGSTLAAGSPQELRFALPAGIVPATPFNQAGWGNDGGGTTMCLLQVDSGGNVRIFKETLGTWVAGANIRVQFTITYERA